MNVYIGGTKDYSAMRGPCYEGYHVPQLSEWEGIKEIMDGLGLSTGTERKNKLHMSLSGYRQASNANRINDEAFGFYATNSIYNDSYPGLTKCFMFSEGTITVGSGRKRSDGLSIRGFYNSFVIPTSSWTIIQGTLGSAGIFWNQDDGLISITSDGSTGYTIMDKNLGATTVYNNGDTLSEANCGKFYQWGNNYGFPWSGSVTTSSTQVNASGYGPGNYYSSSTFITGSADWSSVHNDNLRGGVTGIVSPAELKNAYIGEAPYEGDELCFTANTANSTIKLNKTGSPTAVTLETSPDGVNWSTYTIGNTITLTNIGDKVYWRNTSETNTGFSTSTSSYYKFAMTGSIAGSGDATYLVNKNGTNTLVGTSTYCFFNLFMGCSSLVTPPSLPATTLVSYCYQSMFEDCSNLVEAPSLPAATLADTCYSSMFMRCSSLTKIYELPATTLANSCYSYMFHSCSNLEMLPALPATTMASYCYSNMFNGCSKIKISTTQTGEYQTAYRIPTSGTGTSATSFASSMFANTGGTKTGNGAINTTYYTSNTVV